MILFSILFANLLNSIIKKKKFKFDPANDLNMDKKSQELLRKDLRKYIRSTDFKKLIKIMQKDIDKYFGRVILQESKEDTEKSTESEDKNKNQ